MRDERVPQGYVDELTGMFAMMEVTNMLKVGLSEIRLNIPEGKLEAVKNSLIAILNQLIFHDRIVKNRAYTLFVRNEEIGSVTYINVIEVNKNDFGANMLIGFNNNLGSNHPIYNMLVEAMQQSNGIGFDMTNNPDSRLKSKDNPITQEDKGILVKIMLQKLGKEEIMRMEKGILDFLNSSELFFEYNMNPDTPYIRTKLVRINDTQIRLISMNNLSGEILLNKVHTYKEIQDTSLEIISLVSKAEKESL